MKKTVLLILALGFGIAQGSAQTQKVARHYPAHAPEIPPPVRQPAQPEAWSSPERTPVDGMILLARERSGAFWLASTQGAARFDPRTRERWERWQYFSGRRWLPDDAVQNIWVDPASPHRAVWIRTQTGVSLIEWKPMSLEAKAASFEARIEQRHVRHGMVAGCSFRTPGDPSTSVHQTSDNDGLWTAIYLGAQAYRYAVTGDADARAKARRSVQLLLRLEEITGIPGFPARSFVSKAEGPPQDGEWHPTPDGQWLWKGDTSSDEIVGHYFGYAAYYDLVAEPSEKDQIRRVVARLTDYLIKNDYDLLDVDGQPTRWGRWSEAYFLTEEGKYEAALRSLELLSFLKTAHHITGDAKYEHAYQERVRRGYAGNMRLYRRWPGAGEINFSDDELAYLSYQPLLKYEKDQKLRGLYLDGLRFTWGKVRPDRNPLWNYISAASGAGRMSREIREESRRTLERIPLEMIEWTAKNSHRRDVTFQKEKERFGRDQLTEVLAPDERAVEKWNSNPYRPDGGNGGQGEDDGSYFLLPYWMGRYHGWVK